MINKHIDWQLSLKLAGNNAALAFDMLSLLIKELPQHLQTIKQHAFEKKYDRMKEVVHKLHGALCYCGLPQLKSLISHLENDLRNHIMGNLSTLLNQLDSEVKHILEHDLNTIKAQCIKK